MPFFDGALNTDHQNDVGIDDLRLRMPGSGWPG
jgi:hypothetical protein